MKILFIEPYYGGSHKNFLNDLIGSLDLVDENVKCEIIALPARHWRWRFKGSHFHFSEKVNEKFSSDPPDVMICNSLMDTASFRGLLAPELRGVPLITFFHENQIAYPINKSAPNRKELEKLRDFSYPLVHLNQVLGSDGLIFNSQYNFKTLFDGVEKFLKKMPDAVSINRVLKAKQNAYVLGLGCHTKVSGTQLGSWEKRPPRVLWNHRWEYDKNPEGFIELFKHLKIKQTDLELDLLGSSHDGQASNVFECLKKDFPKSIKAYGGIKSRSEYFTRLGLSRLLPVTSHHDFFGLSVLEAITHGVIPLLPDRLAYPELVPKQLHSKLLYSNSEELKTKAALLLQEGIAPGEKQVLLDYIERYDLREVSSKFLSIVKKKT